ncbi:cysteine-rich CWC family protein [Glaciimonas soli]|uniref:cysteine-rich CWC family protein n=1 Tax=Glaciimonas soli TaxID=2590999 RepID=UPI003898F358
MKQCPSCRKTFFCGPAVPCAACWCDAVPLLITLPATVLHTTEPPGCYCPDCLQDLLRDQAQPHS